MSGAALAVNRAVISEAMRHRERQGLRAPALSGDRGAAPGVPAGAATAEDGTGVKLLLW